jgi:1-acyl-sn-glycerol-3-phosphate acyltransferase
MANTLLNRLGRLAARLYGNALLKMDVQRRAPLPRGAKIIAPNHPATTDPFMMMGLVHEPISILITEMCFKVPVLGRYLRAAGHVPVIDGHGRAAFEEATKLLKAGRTVVIFPEGALSPLEGGLCPPHTGVARLALLTGAPVVPVGVHLQRQGITFRETTVDGKTELARFYLHGPYAVTIGEPVRFEGNVEDREVVRAISQRIMQRIGQLAQQSAYRVRSKARTTRTAPRLAAGFKRAWEKTQPIRISKARTRGQLDLKAGLYHRLPAPTLASGSHVSIDRDQHLAQGTNAHHRSPDANPALVAGHAQPHASCHQ